MVVSANSNIEQIIADLSSNAFDEFCSGLSLMFDLQIQHVSQAVSQETMDAIKNQFTALTAAYAVEGTGSIDGTFYFLLDQPGVFTLPGIIVMFPPKRIETNCKKGTLEDATPIMDAVRELGNLLVGAWDKVAREEFSDNTHLLQTNTHIGPLSEIPEDFFAASAGDELYVANYQITVNSFDPFTCSVIMPPSLFSEKSA